MSDDSKTKPEKGLTYRQAGVDIEAEENVIASLVSKFRTQPIEGLGKPLDLAGHFTGLVEFGDYALSLCTDGVGTKILIAEELEKWDTIGIDCIAMNVNDTICIGAKPIAFVDYLAMEEPSSKIVAEIGEGLSKGAELSGMNIIGGETATLKGIINGIDLAGTCLGYVKRDNIITGENITEGDSVVGLPSSGVHSNGLTLARKIVESKNIGYKDPYPGKTDAGKTLGEVLLTPTRIYVKDVLDLISKYEIKGLANITGGGLKNIVRLKKDLLFNITEPMHIPEIFRLLQEWGNVKTKEMYQTFNMGLGFVIIMPEADANKFVGTEGSEQGAKIIGKVEAGCGLSAPSLNLEF